MNRKYISLILAAILLLTSLTGCEVVSEIAGNVADAAMEELEAQVKETLETYKVEVVEIKTAVGKLNGSSGDIQFFCAGDKHLGFSRSYHGKTVKIYANRSADSWEIPYGKILLGYNLQTIAPDCLVLGPRGFCITEG